MDTTIKIYIRGLVNCLMNISCLVFCLSLGSLFGPFLDKIKLASFSVNPSGFVFRIENISSIFRLCHKYEIFPPS